MVEFSTFEVPLQTTTLASSLARDGHGSSGADGDELLIIVLLIGGSGESVNVMPPSL